jgi:zinc protease
MQLSRANRAFIKIFSVLAFILIPLLASAYVKEYTLNNGLKVLIIEDDTVPLATFQIWYRMGSIDDPAGKTGISHFLEHMMFKGTHKHLPTEFSRIIQRNGGVTNAFITKDHTVYFQTLPSDRIGLSIKLESDRMTNLILDPVEVESERNVIKEERRLLVDDDPQSLLFENLLAAAFKAHPYRQPILGWMSDIAAITREDLYEHYRTFKSPDNAFIVIAGDVKAEDIMPEIKKAFGSIPANGKKIPRIKTEEPLQSGERRIYLKKEAELPYILKAYHVPNFLDEYGLNKDIFALDVLASILSSGRSSRLHKSIVHEKRLALNAFAHYNGLRRDPFPIIFGGTAAPGRDIEELERAINEEIERIKTEPPSEREVQKAKNQVETSFVFAQDSNHSKALYTGMFEMLGSWRLMDKYLEGIRNVTPEDVQAVVKKYLIDDNKTVGILIPVKR